jgi:prepilin-type processing-associated H-X9-DG protein
MSDASGESQRDAKRRAKLIKLGSAVLLILFLFWYLILSPAAQRGRQQANMLQSNSFMKQIGLCLSLYANDHGGQYPDTFGTLYVAVDANPYMFVSPGSKDTPATGATNREIAANLMSGGHCSYVYVGRGLTSNSDADDIVAYERPGFWPEASNVLYADGHVEIDNPDFMRKLTAEVAAGTFPVTMPSNP